MLQPESEVPSKQKKRAAARFFAFQVSLKGEA
jgi:hypothetical protein